MQEKQENRQYRIEVHLCNGYVDCERFFGSFSEVLEFVKCECRSIAVKEVILFEESKYKDHTNHIIIGRYTIKGKSNESK